jgi:hypothetical protein
VGSGVDRRDGGIAGGIGGNALAAVSVAAITPPIGSGGTIAAWVGEGEDKTEAMEKWRPCGVVPRPLPLLTPPLGVTSGDRTLSPLPLGDKDDMARSGLLLLSDRSVKLPLPLPLPPLPFRSGRSRTNVSKRAWFSLKPKVEGSRSKRCSTVCTSDRRQSWTQRGKRGRRAGRRAKRLDERGSRAAEMNDGMELPPLLPCVFSPSSPDTVGMVVMAHVVCW